MPWYFRVFHADTALKESFDVSNIEILPVLVSISCFVLSVSYRTPFRYDIDIDIQHHMFKPEIGSEGS